MEKSNKKSVKLSDEEPVSSRKANLRKGKTKNTFKYDNLNTDKSNIDNIAEEIAFNAEISFMSLPNKKVEAKIKATNTYIQISNNHIDNKDNRILEEELFTYKQIVLIALNIKLNQIILLFNFDSDTEKQVLIYPIETDKTQFYYDCINNFNSKIICDEEEFSEGEMYCGEDSDEDK